MKPPPSYFRLHKETGCLHAFTIELTDRLQILRVVLMTQAQLRVFAPYISFPNLPANNLLESRP